MEELFDKLKKLIADNLEIEADKITMDFNFRQDLGADSLATQEHMNRLGSFRISAEKSRTIKTGGVMSSVLDRVDLRTRLAGRNRVAK